MMKSMLIGIIINILTNSKGRHYYLENSKFSTIVFLWKN